MLALLLIIYALVTVGSTAFAKATSSVVTGASRAKYLIFLIVNGLAACFFFWVFGGFRLRVNLPTLIYAAIYALIVAAILILNMIAYRVASVSGVNIIKSGCGLICTSALGFILFFDDFSLNSVLRIAIMTVAIVFIFVDSRRKDGGDASVKRGAGERRAGSVASLAIVLILLVAVSCANTVTLKYYTMDARVADDNSFFFLTNLFISAGCAVVLIFEALAAKGRISEAREIFKPRALMSILGNTLCSNIGSLVGILLLARMSVSVYTPVTSALGIVAGVVGSLIFREKLGLFSYLAVFAAVVAVII